MKNFLVVGLGNPELRFKNTRHNVGFEVVRKYLNTNLEMFQLDLEIDFEDIISDHDEPYKLYTGKTGSLFHKQRVLVLFPLEYMNDSGRAVQEVAAYYKVSPENILVVHDDKDMEFGKIRRVSADRESGTGGHNGVRSIVEALGTTKFARLKVGVANEFMQSGKVDTSDFVLGQFTAEERTELPKIIEQAVRGIE